MQQIRLADRMGGLGESATLALNARAKQLAVEGKTIYNLTAGELATDTPDYIQQAVAQHLDKNKYTPVSGMAELREAIAANCRDFYDLNWIQASNVVVTAGAKPALYATFLALLDPGDEVIMPTPTWVSYNQLIKLTGATVVEVPMTDNFDLDVEAMLQKVTNNTKAILLNSPHNPTGTIFSQQALTQLSDGLQGKNVTVISDDIYAKLVYDEDFTLVPSCGFENLIIVNGFSKSQALTGWRIGYLIADEAFAKAATSVLSHMMGNAPLPSQYAALAALGRGDRPPQATLLTLKKQRSIVDDAVAAMPNVSYRQPGGAFYAFLDLRALTDSSADWCEKLLLQTGVALVPGEAFSAPGFARLSFVTDEVVLRAALDRIAQFVTEESTA